MTRFLWTLCCVLIIGLALTEGSVSNGEIPVKSGKLRKHNGIHAERKEHLNSKARLSLKPTKPSVYSPKGTSKLDRPSRSKIPKFIVSKKMKSGSTLQLVSLMFRHGDRTPDPQEIKSFPKYELANETWQPVGLGQLTNAGKHRLYNLGQKVRERYGKFLGDVYIFETVNVFSTDFPRTRASALMFNAGLWPPVNEQQWAPDNTLATLWQPISYTPDPELNSVVNSFLVNPCFHKEFARVLKLPEIEEKLLRFEKLQNYLESESSTKFDSPIQIWALQSLYKAHEAAGKEKPKWIENVWDDLNAFSEFFFETLFYNDDLKRMATGPVLKKILSDCKAKADGDLEPKDRKMFVYSGHDTSVAPLFAALGGSNGFIDEDGNPLKSIVPSFGSAVGLELHKVDGEYAVKIVYNEGSKDGSLRPIRLAGCEEMCPLDKYLKLTQNIAVNDQGMNGCDSSRTSYANLLKIRI